MRTPAENIKTEFATARMVVRTSWSENEVMAALSRAEAVALLALGEVLCVFPEEPTNPSNPPPGERWALA